jgi:hypothetical protein
MELSSLSFVILEMIVSLISTGCLEVSLFENTGHRHYSMKATRKNSAVDVLIQFSLHRTALIINSAYRCRSL